MATSMWLRRSVTALGVRTRGSLLHVRTLSVHDRIKATQSKAMEAIRAEASELVLGKHVLIGTGQYSAPTSDTNEQDNTGELWERLIVCSLGSEVREQYEPEQICDLALPEGVGVEAMEHALLIAGATTVHIGELDCVGDGDWLYGSFHETTFHIFMVGQSLARVSADERGPVFILDPLDARAVAFGDIVNVIVWISDDWTESGIDFLLSSGERVAVLADQAGFDLSKWDGCRETMVMVMTEWIVKAAAGLCFQLIKAGYKAPLILPRALTAEGNPKVKQRNELWKAHAALRGKKNTHGPL
eukprot:m.105628 g.105628  ORF g.105628 m.105628 type:complete len:301 (-) comp27663_c0_seq1:200-1102(-)